MKTKVKKAAVVVADDFRLLNHMTMFYVEPGTYSEADVPEMFKIKGRIVSAILISQYHNTMLGTSEEAVPVSLPYQQPKHTISQKAAVAACRKKGRGWHLMTNTEFVYLLHEAEGLGHTIGGNTNHWANVKEQEKKCVPYDSSGHTLTGCEPLTWSHDCTAEGVFGINGNFYDIVTGLRLHNGVIEYLKDNDAAVYGSEDEKTEWIAAEADGKALKLYSRSYRGIKLTTEENESDGWEIRRVSSLQLEGMDKMPQIAYTLGIVPRNWETEMAQMIVNSDIPKAVLCRGGDAFSGSGGGAAALKMDKDRFFAHHDCSFRSALFLENWEQVTEVLNTGTNKKAGQ